MIYNFIFTACYSFFICNSYYFPLLICKSSLSRSWISEILKSIFYFAFFRNCFILHWGLFNLSKARSTDKAKLPCTFSMDINGHLVVRVKIWLLFAFNKKYKIPLCFSWLPYSLFSFFLNQFYDQKLSLHISNFNTKFFGKSFGKRFDSKLDSFF